MHGELDAIADTSTRRPQCLWARARSAHDVPAVTGALIRVGLIGHGMAGAFIHAPLLEAAEAYRITAIATSRPDAGSARRDHPRSEADAFSVATARDVDLVVIASPNQSHFPLAKAALEAGKNVVIDKPFVLRVADADILIELAERAGRVLSVFHNRRWDGDFIAVRDLIAGGKLGKISLYEARWDRNRLAGNTGWRDLDEPGSGLLWDLGPHLIDQALQLFGPPDSIASDIAVQRTGATACDYFELTLRYGAMRCILSASNNVSAARPRFAVHGDRGSFVIRGLDPIELALRAGRKPSDPRFLLDLPPITADLVVDGNHETRGVSSGCWLDYYARLAAAVRGDALAPVSAREARQSIAMIEAAYADAQHRTSAENSR